MQKVLFEKSWGIYALIVSIAFLLSAGLVFAQEPQTTREERTETREAVQSERVETREATQAERVENREVKQEERRAALEERAKERIKAYGERIVRRLNAMVERLGKLADRMESRIEKLEAREFDLSVARGLLETARLEIANAQSAVDSVGAAVEAAVEAENPREAFGAVRELLNEAKDSVRLAHKALVEAIKEIKAGTSVRPEVEDEEVAEEDHEGHEEGEEEHEEDAGEDEGTTE